MRFGPFRLIVWFTCMLLAAGAPAAAWDATKCMSTNGPKTFRDEMIGLLTKWNLDFLSHAGDDFPTYKQDAYDTINDCQKKLSESEKAPFAKCMSRVMPYAEVISRTQGNPDRRVGSKLSLGLDMSNYDYFRTYKDILKIPPCLNEPSSKELFETLDKTNLSDEDSVETTVNLIKQRCKGAVVVPYVSQTVTSLDTGVGDDKYGRIVVLIQADNTSHYIQFTVSTHDPSGELRRRQASVVKVKKSGGNMGTYIFDWQRTDDNEFVYTGRDLSLFGNDQHCYTCHWSGVLSIHPFGVPTTERPDVGQAGPTLGSELEYKKWLPSLNAKYASEKTTLNAQAKVDAQNPDWNKVVRSPSLDNPPNLFTRPSESCSAAKKNEISALNPDSCNGSTCHQKRGKAIFELGNYRDMINKYVAGGLMPLGNAASADTRGSASECFQADAASKMTTWLKGADAECSQ
jgi:hypothetical protein